MPTTESESDTSAAAAALAAPRCGTKLTDSGEEKQEACNGTGQSKRCLRVYRRRGAKFKLVTDNFDAGIYHTTDNVQGTAIWVACAPLKVGLHFVTIDGVQFPIQDTQPDDNCG